MMLDGMAYGLGRTHEPALAAAIAVARPGPVLELGAGYYSTPLLHALCVATGRELLTVDTDRGWIDRLMSLSSPNHRLVALARWDELAELTHSKLWSVIFVDHAPAERRVVDIEQLADKTDLMVVHDSEHSIYNYEPTFALFKNRFDYKRMMPWTTILSNVRSDFPSEI
jgi:hypothetical protein